jgi:predicted MPP superfamily phosphohydrolase
MSSFSAAGLAAWATVVLVSALQRGRPYATFVGVLLGIHTLSSVALYPHLGPLKPVFAALQLGAYLHFALLARPRMRPAWYRRLISLPASYLVAATFLALPWAIAAGLGFRPVAVWLPFALAGLGFLDSLGQRAEDVHLTLDGTDVGGLRRHRSGTARQMRPLRLVQISDPHLGPFMPEERLREVCEHAVAANPDLVLLTGDFLTMESQSDAQVLARALEPLQALSGRTFACPGNHDHEAPEVVVEGLREAGVQLLVDEMTTVETEAGAVEVIGYDFRWREREAHLQGVTARFPRTLGVTRIALLHDPGAFKHLPEGSADLVLSGHTHGGQLGLLRLGLPHTVVSALTRIPDHGFWARGLDRLYVHRGTGHYGFPIRLGVPAEKSVLHVHRLSGSGTAAG